VTALALAFVAGLLSILSPCVLPLVPIVLGAAVTAHPLGAVALAAGLAVSFTGLGLLLALVGFGLGIDAGAFRLAAAVIIILLVPSWQARLAAAGSPISGWADRRFGGAARSGLAGQFAIGLLLGAVWSPCVGPTLGAASLLASQGRDLPQVALTMVLFGIGAALPLILLGLVSRATLMAVRARLMSAGKLGKALLGAAFILIGAAIVSGADKRVEAALVDASPQWLTELTTSF
jgi:cytochrome c-type biogenesis protein